MATTLTIGVNWHGMAVKPTKRYTSDAAIAGAIVSDIPAILCGFIASNGNGSARYLQIFDSATVPADGAVPMVSIAMAANSSFAFSEIPMTCANGIYMCLSTTQNTKTLAGADMVLLAYSRY